MIKVFERELNELPDEDREFAKNLIREWVENVLGALTVVRMCRAHYEAGELMKRLDDVEKPARLLAEINKLQRTAMKLQKELNLPTDARIQGEDEFRQRYKEGTTPCQTTA